MKLITLDNIEKRSNIMLVGWLVPSSTRDNGNPKYCQGYG